MSGSTRFAFGGGSRRILSKLKHWMKHHPVAANSVLCLNLWVAGDVLAQYSEHKLMQEYHVSKKQETTTTATTTTALHSQADKKEDHVIDPWRVACTAGFGAFIYGPIFAVWYPYLHRVCKAYNVTARYGLWGAPILKVVADELLMSPPALGLFFGYMNICEGGTLQTYQNKLSEEFLTSWMASITFWPPITLLTFRYLPVYAQAPVINAMCIIWDAFLSHRNAVANIKEQAEASENEKLIQKKDTTVMATLPQAPALADAVVATSSK